MNNFLNNAMNAVNWHKFFAANLLKIRFPVLFANFWLETNPERRDNPKSFKDKFSIKYEQVRDYVFSYVNENIKNTYNFFVSSVFGKTMRRTANLSVRLIQAMQSKDPFAISSYVEVGLLFASIVFGATAQGYIMKRDREILKKSKYIDEIQAKFSEISKDKKIDSSRYEIDILTTLKNMQKDPELLQNLPKVAKDESQKSYFSSSYNVLANNPVIRALGRLAVKFWTEDIVYEYMFKKAFNPSYWFYHIYGFGYSLGLSAGTAAIKELQKHEQKIANFENHYGGADKRYLQNLLLAIDDFSMENPVGKKCQTFDKPIGETTFSKLLKYGAAVAKSDLGVPTNNSQTYETHLAKLLEKRKAFNAQKQTNIAMSK